MTHLTDLESHCRRRVSDGPEASWARLAAAVGPTTEWLLATIPVGAKRARGLWQFGESITGDEPAMLWFDAANGERAVALGSAGLAIEANGSDRARCVISRAERLLRSVECVALPGQPIMPPRLFGGFSFVPGPRHGTFWHDFPDAGFVLPRWLYLERDGSALLTHAIHITELHSGSGSAPGSQLRLAAGSPWKRLTRVGALIEALPHDRTDDMSRRPHPISLEAPDEAAWAERVNLLRTELRAGALRKVVLARHSSVTLESQVDTAWLIGRLEQEAPGCNVFAVRRGATTFVGASPEWLLRLHGSLLETEALAGSCSAEAPPSALFGSPKDRAEHELVVSALVETLTPLASRLSRPPEPELLRLRHLLHLRTPIHAELLAWQHPLQLVERLHPTPAVGGTPTPEALDAISRFEGGERGWYAAPLGWFDAHGNARFIVGLRSGVVAGNTAHVFAGAGIMPDSQAGLESMEIRLKQRGFLRALGVEE